MPRYRSSYNASSVLIEHDAWGLTVMLSQYVDVLAIEVFHAPDLARDANVSLVISQSDYAQRQDTGKFDTKTC